MCFGLSRSRDLLELGMQLSWLATVMRAIGNYSLTNLKTDLRSRSESLVMSLTGIVSASWIETLSSVFVLDVGRGSESDRRSIFLVIVVVWAVFAVPGCADS